ncbi:hypothetical protein [Streptomyces sp. NPDC056387]
MHEVATGFRLPQSRTREGARKRGRLVAGAKERPAPEPGTVLPGGSR